MRKSRARRLAALLALVLSTGLFATGCVIHDRGYDGSYGNDRDGYDRGDGRGDRREDRHEDRDDDRRDWGRRRD